MSLSLRSQSIVLFWILSTGFCQAQTSAQTLKTRFLKEYPEAALRLEDYYSRLKGNLNEEERYVQATEAEVTNAPKKNLIGIGGNPFPQVPIRQGTAKFAINQGFVRLETHRLMTKFMAEINKIPTWVEVTDPERRVPDRVSCIGRESGFSFQRDLKTGVPVLKNVSTETKGIQLPLQKGLFRALYAPFSLDTHRISTLLKEQTITVDAVSEIVEAGRKQLKVNFKSTKEVSKAFPFRSGWFLVSPDEGWILTKYELAIKSFPKYLDCVVEYQLSADGPLLPAKVTFRDPWSTVVTTFENLRHETVPESEFTLTAFGLPDISKPIAEPTPGGSARWYYLAAGLAVVVAVGLKTYSSRVASRRQPTPLA